MRNYIQFSIAKCEDERVKHVVQPKTLSWLLFRRTLCLLPIWFWRWLTWIIYMFTKWKLQNAKALHIVHNYIYEIFRISSCKLYCLNISNLMQQWNNLSNKQLDTIISSGNFYKNNVVLFSSRSCVVANSF